MAQIKINWGYSIFIAYVIFGGFIITLVVGTLREKVDLIEENYYEAEVVYQQKMEAISRAKNMDTLPSIHQHENSLIINLPGNSTTKGAALFKRPDDAGIDFEIPLQSGLTPWPAENIRKGAWIIHIQWTTDGASYFFEESMYLQ